jgi:hypothetical protein
VVSSGLGAPNGSVIRTILLFGALAAVICLAGCSGAGGQLTGNRGAGDGACGGAQATAFGGGYVGILPPGAMGTVDITPTGCKAAITGWTFPPPALATGPVAIQPAPAVIAPMQPLAVIKGPGV